MPEYVDLRIGALNPLARKPEIFQASDKDTSANPVIYYGLVNHLGWWIIIKDNVSTGATRYAAGQGNYSTSWTDRASLTYGYYYEAV